MSEYSEMTTTEFASLKRVMQGSPGSKYYYFVMSCKGYEFINRRTGKKIHLCSIYTNYIIEEIEQMKYGNHPVIKYRKKNVPKENR